MTTATDLFPPMGLGSSGYGASGARSRILTASQDKTARLWDSSSGKLLATLQGQFTTEWDVVMAGSVFSILPIAIVYLLAQRHIIAGVATTGIK